MRPSATGSSYAAPMRTSWFRVLATEEHVVREAIRLRDHAGGLDRHGPDAIPPLPPHPPREPPDLQTERRLDHDQLPEPAVHHEGPSPGVARALDRVLALELLITDQEPVEAEELGDSGEDVPPGDAEREVLLR